MAANGIAAGALLGGRYRLDGPLSDTAEAGFWRGTDTVLGRTVAIHAVAHDDPRAADMIEAARASATVTDPHLLRVLDCDEHDGVVWVVNEWAEGATLAELLVGGPLAPERAARLTREVAEALASAHAIGVAHGRLSPEAVLLTDAGTVRLIGFAVAAALARDTGADGDLRDAQPWGYEPNSALQADVIDLAAVLYAGLTGRWAGIAPSALPVAPGDLRGPLRPRQVRAGVPRMLDTLCERVLRREAHEHELPVETAQEVLAALTNEVGDETTGVLDLADEETLVASTPRSGGSHLLTAPYEPAVAEPTGAWKTEATATEDPEATQAALSLPPFVDSPERPLFADGDRRPPDRARGSSAWLYGDGAATGTLDPVLDGPVRAAGAGGRRTGRRALAVLGVLLVVAATAVAFEVTRGHGTAAPTRQRATAAAATPTTTPIRLADVSDFDPEGNPSTEHPDEVPLATDGKASTGWTTMTYTRPALGGLKSGVGLLLDLGADQSVASVHLRLTGSPTDLALYAAPTGTSTAPSDIASMERVARATQVGTQVTLRPSAPVHTRYLVVWLTSLPRAGDGYRGEIDEMTVRG